MAALDPDLDVLSILVDGILRRGDGGSGFDMSAQDQITAVADSAQDASGMVSGFLYGAVGIMEKSVVVGGAFGAGGIDTVSDFYGFNSADGKKGFPKAGVQFIEDGGAKSGGQSADAAFDDAAGGVLRCHAFLEIGWALAEASASAM